LIRSYLYIPAIKEKYFEKIDSNSADAIIFDLEDSVSLENKEEAREILQKFFNQEKNVTKEIFIRINSEQIFSKDDIKLVKKNVSKIRGIFLPKINNCEEIEKIVKAIGDKSIEIIPLIETPTGVLNLEEISKNKEVTTVALGEVDLSYSLNINPNEGLKQLIPLRLFVNLVIAAYEKMPPIGPVWTNIDDKKGLENHMDTIKSLGYSGAQLIHPSQIDITNKIFSYSDEEIKWAKSILKTYNELESNLGSFRDSNNEMVDEAVIKRAQKLIESIEDNN
tara:strand:- start:2681 stop:3517 length:837 start_codon:yes stop_codon:yes gene_type:complete